MTPFLSPDSRATMIKTWLQCWAKGSTRSNSSYHEKACYSFTLTGTSTALEASAKSYRHYLNPCSLLRPSMSQLGRKTSYLPEAEKAVIQERTLSTESAPCLSPAKTNREWSTEKDANTFVEPKRCLALSWTSLQTRANAPRPAPVDDEVIDTSKPLTPALKALVVHFRCCFIFVFLPKQVKASAEEGVFLPY
ncbi:hypothetical protein WG66_005289 [Moniliophthora roreri]|nr:hypothetical protein WG66_005289 [Moniliophthora roreri]